MTCLGETQELEKNPNFHRSYVWKYFEPRSKIFKRYSLGFWLLSINISDFEPSYKKIYR